jgi:lactoylglutathione lyase
MRINYSIIFVSDMERSVAFYHDEVGIPLKFETPEWTEFATEGATLALHKSDAPTPDGKTQRAEQAGQCRAGFQVPNLDEFHKRMTERNVPCVQDPTETFGVKIAQYVDPDGLILSVSGARKANK